SNGFAGAAPVQVPSPATPVPSPSATTTTTPIPYENRLPATPQNGGTGAPLYDKYYGPSTQPPQPMPPAGTSFPPQPNVASPVRPFAPPPPAPVQLNRIAAIPTVPVEGQVVRNDNAPRPGAVVRFVSLNRQEPEKTTTANSAGRFSVNLPSGTWLVYM